MISRRLRSYLETALWSSTDDDGEPLDKNFGIEDIDTDSILTMEGELDEFFDYLEELGLLELIDADDGMIAHDFWLTRNGHGAGFWDGDYGDLGDTLTSICKRWGEVNLLVEGEYVYTY